MAAFSSDPFLVSIDSQKAEQFNSQLVVSNSMLGTSQIHFCVHLVYLIHRIYLRRLQSRAEAAEAKRKREELKKKRDADEEY
jgi:hypothetical protein